MSEPQSERTQALSMLKAVHDDQSATLPSGREYTLTKMTHKQRRRVFAFFTKKQREIQNGDFSFLDSPDFEPVEKSSWIRCFSRVRRSASFLLYGMISQRIMSFSSPPCWAQYRILFGRRQWRLKVPTPLSEPSLIAYSNLSNEVMIEHALVRYGYGTLIQVRKMDTQDFLDAVEYQEITSAIEQYRMEQAHRER